MGPRLSLGPSHPTKAALQTPLCPAGVWLCWTKSKTPPLRTCIFGYPSQVLSFSTVGDPSALGNAEVELTLFRNLTHSRRGELRCEPLLLLPLQGLKKGKRSIELRPVQELCQGRGAHCSSCQKTLVSCLVLEGKEWVGGRRSWRNSNLLMSTRLPGTDICLATGTDGDQPNISAKIHPTHLI